MSSSGSGAASGHPEDFDYARGTLFKRKDFLEVEEEAKEEAGVVV